MTGSESGSDGRKPSQRLLDLVNGLAGQLGRGQGDLGGEGREGHRLGMIDLWAYPVTKLRHGFAQGEHGDDVVLPQA